MNTGTMREKARTFLTHFFGRGLDDARYVVERFICRADGEIKPYARRGGRKEARKVMSFRAIALPRSLR